MRDPETLEYRPDSGPAGAVDRFEVPSNAILAAMPARKTEPEHDKSLDSPKTRRKFRDLFGHYLREIDIHAEARAEMAEDEAFYDNDQWAPEDRKTLEERGQEALVLNVTAQSINWILGTERRGRTDFKVLPRRKDGAKGAERKSQILKWLSDVNRSEFSNSRAFAETVKAGLGWLECGVQDDADGEPIYDRMETWRNIIWDSAATEMDLSDARFIFRTKFMDGDAVKAMFPGRDVVIDMAANGRHDYGPFLDSHGDEAMDSLEASREAADISVGTRQEFGEGFRTRLRVVEAWYREPRQENRMRGGEFNGELFDPGAIGHYLALQRGDAEIVKRLTWRMHVMIMTSAGVLWHSPSPYRHNAYPFTPIWGYRRASDGMPYGVIRGMKGAQKDINKRFSKALAILSSNKILMEEGAVDNVDDLIEEVSNPNAVIVHKTGKRIELAVDRDLAAPHLQIMQMSVGMIQSLSGVTDESLGRTTNASSGKAITARQEQGALATAPIFDNLRYARQVHGEKLLSLTEQFMTDERQFRVTNSRGQATYITINDGTPENDILRTKADYIISEDAWNATIRQGQAEALFELMAQLAPVAPQVVLVLLDLVIEAMDVPARDEIVKRIRSTTGQEDPDADPNAPPDPEKIARDQQKAMQAEMEQRAAMAQIETAEGKAAEAKARAAKIAIEAQRLAATAPGENMAEKRAALELAIAMLQAEPALDVADVLLQQAKAETGQAPPAPTPPVPEAPSALPAPEEGFVQ